MSITLFGRTALAYSSCLALVTPAFAQPEADAPQTEASNSPETHDDDAGEEIIVQATRSGRRIGDEPVRSR
jgi:hypothetical protein